MLLHTPDVGTKSADLPQQGGRMHVFIGGGRRRNASGALRLREETTTGECPMAHLAGGPLLAITQLLLPMVRVGHRSPLPL